MYRIYFLALFHKKRLKFPRWLYMEFLDISNIYICMDTNTEKFAKNKVKTSNIASPVYTACLLVRYYCSTFLPKTLQNFFSTIQFYCLIFISFRFMVFKLLILLRWIDILKENPLSVIIVIFTSGEAQVNYRLLNKKLKLSKCFCTHLF